MPSKIMTGKGKLPHGKCIPLIWGRVLKNASYLNLGFHTSWEKNLRKDFLIFVKTDAGEAL
jgi:hypothetical protein